VVKGVREVKEEELEIQLVVPAKAMLQGKTVLLPSPNPALKPLKKPLQAIALVKSLGKLQITSLDSTNINPILNF
jgi:hypothetical protein